MNDFAKEPAELLKQELAAVGNVLESGWFILGAEVEKFETNWAEECGAASAVGVANGMDAIEIMLRSLDIGRGDEVITTTMSAFASVLGIVRAGATPVLADINPGTGLMSIESAQRCVSASTKAVLVVHLYGQVKDMDKWSQFCADNDLLLLEDCAQAHGAQWRGGMAGSFGRAAAFSFYPTKNLGAIGDAGAIVTSDSEIAERSRVLRNYGQGKKYHHLEFGLNSRLDEIQAALLNVRLKWLEVFTLRRREIAQRYRRELSGSSIQNLLAPDVDESHVHHLYVIMSAERDYLQSHLAQMGVHANIHYPIPIHRQPLSRTLLHDPEGLGNSESFSEQILSLPCHPQMTDDDVDSVIQAVNSFRRA